jgi:hypothetical protein
MLEAFHISSCQTAKHDFCPFVFFQRSMFFKHKWQEHWLSIKMESFIYREREPNKHAQTGKGA